MRGPLIHPERYYVLGGALFGILITCGLLYISLSNTLAQQQNEFDERAKLVAHGVVHRAHVVEESLENLVRLFHASLHVDADQFRLFAEDLIHQHSFIDSIYYTPRITRDERGRFEARMRENGYSSFTIHDFHGGTFSSAAIRKHYYPVTYLSPFVPHAVGILGYDLDSSETLRPAIEHAARSGKTVLTGPSEAIGSRVQVILKAVYAGKIVPTDDWGRVRDTNGLLAVGLKLQDMLSGLPEIENLSLTLRDASGQAAAGPPIQISHRGAQLRDSRNRPRFWHESAHSMTIGDRDLVLTVREPFHWGGSVYLPALMALFTGLLLTATLIVLGKTAQKRTLDLESRNRDINLLVRRRTDELAKEKVLLEQEIRVRQKAQDESIWLSQLLDESSNEIYVFDAVTFRFIKVNQGASRNLGYSMQRLRELAPWDLEPEFSEARFRGLVQPLIDGDSQRLVFETRHRRCNGTSYPVEVRLHLSRSTGRLLFIAVIEDISARIRHQERLQYLAEHDALTGLPNRSLFIDRVRHALVQAPRHQTQLAILFLDLDRFKLVNDTMGHESGDHLLQEVARLLAESVREGDTVARLGGDEFTILLEDLHDGAEAGVIATKIQSRLASPISLQGQDVYINASIGIATYPQDGGEAGVLLKNADAAMYRAKGSGGNNSQFYRVEIGKNALERLTLETSLRRALEREEFVLHYQPEIELESGRVVGLEALLRWRHPDMGLLPPGRFIPLLEESGLIIPVGEWVMRTACAAARHWQRGAAIAPRIAVNLSVRQFNQPELPAVIHRIVDQVGDDARLLELELTESVVMHDAEAAVEILNQISEMGVRIAIDDFGTGYSSLSYLRRLPIHTLKVDRSFIKDLTVEADNAAIVHTVISMAHALKLDIVAEGVETAGQASMLQEWNCQKVQGYLFSRPQPEAAIPELLNLRHWTGLMDAVH